MAPAFTRRTAISTAAAFAFGRPLARIAAQTPGYPFLIDVQALLERLEDPSSRLRLLDASPLRIWRNGHIPGATHVFWQDTVDANYPVFGAVVTQGFEQSQRLEVIRRFGVEPADSIVVYDDTSGFRAARIVWFLRLLGFPDVSLLDGGLQGWRDLGEDAEAGSPSPPEVQPAVDPQEGFYVVTEALADRIARADTTILDIRTAEEQRDTLNGALPLGAIPTAQRWPWDGMIDPDSNALLPLEGLRTQIAPLGLRSDRDIVVYGRFGVDTALSWLVLKTLGFERVLTYDRGWVEWAATEGLGIDALT
ncbi:MAG: sulfurtransferase [Thermomicrobiales bacterium]|nr:sulfurtransferase [Thermomicrobiales bacterium]